MASSSSPQLFPNERPGLTNLCAVLPALPFVLRYYDEFEDTVRSIPSPHKEDVFQVMQNGERRRIDFTRFDPECRLIFKHVCVFLIMQNLNIGTVYNYLFYATQLTTDDVAAITVAKPNEIGWIWRQLRGRALQPQAYKAAKSLLLLLCAYRFNGWSEDYHTYISTTLPLPAVDKYAAVRSGDVFLSADEEAFIVRHLDDLTHRLRWMALASGRSFLKSIKRLGKFLRN